VGGLTPLQQNSAGPRQTLNPKPLSPTLRPATSSQRGDSCTAGHSSRYAAMGSDANTSSGRQGRTRAAMGASRHAPTVNAQPCSGMWRPGRFTIRKAGPLASHWPRTQFGTDATAVVVMR
jgi:hypothetical protein